MVTNEAIKAMRNRVVCMENESKPWSDEDSKALGTYYDDGYGITEIAVILQRSERAVFQQLSLMGAFQSPKKRAASKKEPPVEKLPECLCGICGYDPALCPNREHCPKRKEMVEC